MFKLKGIYAPIPTPFVDAHGPIAFDKLESNMAFWNDSDLTGVVVMGSNGEFVVLDWQEKCELIDKACEYAKDKKSVIAGCGCESTRDTIKMCEHAAKAGADAALVLSPNYYKRAMTDAINKNFYIEVADASPIPVILYNMPGNSGINLTSSLVSSLASHPNIIGVKDSGGNIVQISEIIRDTPDDFAVFAGSASFLFHTLAVGGVGGTLALANIFPNECAKLQTLVEQGNMEDAAELQLKILESNTAVTARWGIAGLKAAMEIVGLYGGTPRKPLMPLGAEERKQLTSILEKLKG
ncbi:MAG: dihydrodipicolinate synthase family protein [Clostridia bacterium]